MQYALPLTCPLHSVMSTGQAERVRSAITRKRVALNVTSQIERWSENYGMIHMWRSVMRL
jgi:hypothetical protein